MSVMVVYFYDSELPFKFGIFFVYCIFIFHSFEFL